MNVNHAPQETHRLRLHKNRQFGLIVGGVLGLIAAYMYWQKGSLNFYLFMPAMLLLLLALFVPKTLTFFRVAWEKTGLFLGRINTYIILTLIYFFIFVPYGLLLQVLRKDFMGLKTDRKATSYWQEKSRQGSSMKHQF